MATDSEPSPEIHQLWSAVLASLGSQVNPSQAQAEEIILFHGAAPKHYILTYSLSVSQWLTMPWSCWKFTQKCRSLRSNSSWRAIEDADTWLTQIEFAGKTVHPSLRQRIRQNRLRYQISLRALEQAFTAVGLQQKHGQLKLFRQPQWVYRIARITTYLLVAATAVVNLIALSPIVEGRFLPPGSFSLFLMALVLGWMASIAEAFGSGWTDADKTRSQIGLCPQRSMLIPKSG